MRLTHQVCNGTSVAVVEVTGEVDLETGPALRAKVVETAGTGVPVVVDLSRVEFFDSTGLRALDEARADLADSGGRFVLAGVAPRVLRLFQITGLDTQFALYASVDDAAAGVAAAGVDRES